MHVTELKEGVCDGKTQFRAEREQPETATIHVADTMMTNDTMPYVVISAYPGIEFAHQYDCRFAKSIGGWNTTCHKCDLSHHQMSLK